MFTGLLRNPRGKINYYGQQGMPPVQQIAPIAQQAPTASTVLDAKSAVAVVAIFNNLIFI